MQQKRSFGARQLALAAMLTAIVAVLQILANAVQPIPGISLTFVLVPVVIGAALLGKWVGAWLGFAFGVIVLLTGGATMFLELNATGTIITVLVKGTLAGLCAALVYKALEKVNFYLAAYLAAAVCPIVNTGIFCIGCRLFFWDAISNGSAAVQLPSAQAAGFSSPLAYVIIGFAGINFLIELGINILLAPIIIRLIRAGRKYWD